MKKKVDIFLILCLKLLQVKKAISYHLLEDSGYRSGSNKGWQVLRIEQFSCK